LFTYHLFIWRMVNLNKSSKSKGPKDFEKAKIRVGKAKPGAVNATNTSFKAKRLNLKEQDFSTQQKVSSLAAKDPSLREDLLAVQLRPFLTQTGHYNVGVRRDAYGNILRLIRERQPGEVETVLGALME